MHTSTPQKRKCPGLVWRKTFLLLLLLLSPTGLAVFSTACCCAESETGVASGLPALHCPVNSPRKADGEVQLLKTQGTQLQNWLPKPGSLGGCFSSTDQLQPPPNQTHRCLSASGKGATKRRAPRQDSPVTKVHGKSNSLEGGKK